MFNPLLTTYHLAVNKKRQAVIYRRTPPLVFYPLTLLPLTALSSLFQWMASLLHLEAAVTFFEQVTYTFIVFIVLAAVMVLISLVMGETYVFENNYKALYYPSKEQAKALLPSLTLKGYSNFPCYLEGLHSYYPDDDFYRYCTCLVSQPGKEATTLLKTFLKTEKERKAVAEEREEAKAAREAAEAELTVRKLWQ